MPEKSDLGSRMKRYESVPQIHLSIKTPVIIRLDGKAFHTFTRQLETPFDPRMSNAMITAAVKTSEKIQGFKVGFTASDEVSILVSDFDRIESSAWFDYNVQKIVSISAAYMSVYFNEAFGLNSHDWAVFDSRVFNIPKEDVANYFLWRQKDWARNSVSAYASMFFSHKQLDGKSTKDRHEMLHTIGKNWATDLSSRYKNGTYFSPFTQSDEIIPTFEVLNHMITGIIKDETDDESGAL